MLDGRRHVKPFPASAAEPAVLNRQADFCRNRQLLAEIGEELDGGAGAGSHVPDPADLLARARAERDLPDAASSARLDQDVA